MHQNLVVLGLIADIEAGDVDWSGTDRVFLWILYGRQTEAAQSCGKFKRDLSSPIFKFRVPAYRYIRPNTPYAGQNSEIRYSIHR